MTLLFFHDCCQFRSSSSDGPHYLNVGPLFRLCGLIRVCEKAPLVSQTLNGALALITANLWPLLVISDAATDTYHQPAQIHRLG